MNMKKKILAAILFGCALNSSAFAEKVTYDKATADAKAYQESLPSYENETSGLGASETNSIGERNQMGKWVNVGAIALQSAGVYSTMLTPGALNTSCIKGEKGFVPKKTTTYKRECTYWKPSYSDNSSMEVCGRWENIATHSYHDNGYKAECR